MVGNKVNCVGTKHFSSSGTDKEYGWGEKLRERFNNGIVKRIDDSYDYKNNPQIWVHFVGEGTKFFTEKDLEFIKPKTLKEFLKVKI